MTRMITKEAESLLVGGAFSGWEKWVSVLYKETVSILSYVRSFGDPIYIDEINHSFQE